MTKRVFKAGNGAGFNDETAQVYGEFLWKIREENGDVLTPGQVVQKAKPKDSPIHDFFEWENATAAEKYRIWQARFLLGRIEIIVESDGEEDQVKAFHNITIKNEDDESERGYVTLSDVQSNRDYLDIVLENALDEIKAWQKRYSQYKRLNIFKPLKPIFTTIKQTVGKSTGKIRQVVTG